MTFLLSLAGPLAPLLMNPEVGEVVVNGPFDVWVELDGKLRRVDTRFRDSLELRQTAVRLVSACGRRIDDATPMVDARLPDGSRVNVVLPPLAVDGPLITIRRFGTAALRFSDLVARGAISSEQARDLTTLVRGRRNTLISGGTGTGKTTLLGALTGLVPASERIVTVEDAAELSVQAEHVARLEARPANVEGRGAIDLRQLVRNALRMRPDRLIVGEIRGGEAIDLLLAMNTGHDGSLATIHANGPDDALRRLETMALMGGVDIPHTAIREQIASAVHAVVHVVRSPDGGRSVASIHSVEREGAGWQIRVFER
ncbi:MAG: CpaF family protein [Thermoleophilia bacterium]|nr:CpaF family protein [Thermoleophilia bacterium]